MEDQRTLAMENQQAALTDPLLLPAARDIATLCEKGAIESLSENSILQKADDSQEMKKVLWDEAKEASAIAIPTIVVFISQYLLRASPLIMLGHLGDLTLSSTAIAHSICNVSGYSFLTGMSTALETLCGQAYGAGQYKRLGTLTYGAMVCLFLMCIPVSMLWMFVEKLLIYMGQDPSISKEAGKYAMCLIPSLIPFVTLQALIRYLMIQGLILPMLITSVVALCFHLPLCWALVFKTKLGSVGAAFSIGLSYSLNVILLLIYVNYSSTCKKTRASFSKDVFPTMPTFFKLAIPSALMIGIKWWSSELVILLSGLFPNPTVETSVLTICLTVTSVHYLIPYAFGAAASTRISRNIGAGKPQIARIVLFVVLIPAVAETVLASVIIFACRSILGYAFTYEIEVVNYIKEIIPLICLSIVLDGMQGVLAGVARGCGWQKLGAYLDIVAYYLVGIPMSLLMGFVLNFRGKGLWGGLVVGATLQVILLSIISGFTNWEKQALEARQRISDGSTPPHNELIE